MSEHRKPALVELHSRSITGVAWDGSRLPEGLVKVLSSKDGVTFFLARTPAGGEQPARRDRFRQIRYVMQGEFVVNGKPYGPGTMIDIPEETDYAVSAPPGGEWFVLELPVAPPQSSPSGSRPSAAS